MDESTPAAAAEAVRPTLTAAGTTFGPADAALLRAVEREGALSTAAEVLGRSYSRAHDRLGDLEAAFGDLLTRRRGGPDGGGSTLTDTGRRLLVRYDRLRAALDGVTDAPETALRGTVTDRTDGLATVATDAGPIRAVVPASASAVSVAVRADAVTLHDPEAAPGPDATSARNRLDGRVVALEAGAGVVDVRVDVGAAQPLAATVTADSATRLGLTVDRRVVATFKATATRGVDRQPSRV